MYYASIGIIALIVLVIINIEALRKVPKTSDNELRLKYRRRCIFLGIRFCLSARLERIGEQAPSRRQHELRQLFRLFYLQIVLII